MNSIAPDAIRQTVADIVARTAITDIHTHLYDHPFGDLLLWGIDELLTYHYLVAELFRACPISCNAYWALSRTEQANLIWNELFVQRSPVSEACRGVLTTLHAFGLDTSVHNLNHHREFFSATDTRQHIDRVLSIANISSLVMTNDPFDDLEHPLWKCQMERDPRFRAALRIDPVLMQWSQAAQKARAWGYDVSGTLDTADLTGARQLLEDWTGIMRPEYLAVSLPPTFAFPENSPRARMLDHVILPLCREHNTPFAMMIGVKKLVNPALRLAGDSVGKSDICAVEYLCENYPDNRFLVTMLSRENQHELCVTARKYSNLMVFGCWWFMNNPSIIQEMTRERLELLGLSFIPQHSDARVLDQLVYKWSHSRRIISAVLADKYDDLAATGWQLTPAEIERDVALLLGGNFERFVTRG